MHICAYHAHVKTTAKFPRVIYLNDTPIFDVSSKGPTWVELLLFVDVVIHCLLWPHTESYAYTCNL
jgi:hypothetical protein